MNGNNQDYIEYKLPSNTIMRIHPITEYSFRIRLSPDGNFQEPSLIRYGILQNSWNQINYSVSDDDDSMIINTGKSSLSISKLDGRIVLCDDNGKTLVKEAIAPDCTKEKGFSAVFELMEGEKFYGLGDETRDRIQKRGYSTEMWVKNVSCYVPIPFLMSTAGWAIFLNTTWRHFFDIGDTQKDRLRFWSTGGQLDYYLIAGKSLPELLDRYTDIAGKPHLLPLWGYALTFVCNQQVNAREMLDDCLNFRREKIPCDLVGLEPGWMEKNYDFTTQKKWHPERFFLPYWSPKGPHTFIGAAQRLGFKMSLWLCCDYDLSIAEEIDFSAKPIEETVSSGRHPDDFEQDEHLGAVNKSEENTTTEYEPWFEHLRKFVDQGVSAFKMDGSNQVVEHPDRKWGNGMTDEEMHNLYPTLLNKQMSLGFKEHTGKRAMIYSSGGFTGIQKYSATWAGDTGGGPKPLVSMLNHGLSGHSNTSCDMDVFSPEAIHFGFLMPWSQLCSWAYWRHPWFLDEKSSAMFKYYAKLRYNLLPYIYSMAHIASKTGMPIMRSMNLMFPDDPKCENCMNQYMFGESLLVGAFTDKIYLPDSRWIDYWTGIVYEGKQEITYQIPEGFGGLLFIRDGAIIPYWQVMDFVGQKPVDNISLHVYPNGESLFTLYEDDGTTYKYLDGEFATTDIKVNTTDHETSIDITPRKGSYDDMPEKRSFEVIIHNIPSVTNVLINGKSLKDQEWSYDKDSQTFCFKVTEDPDRVNHIHINHN